MAVDTFQVKTSRRSEMLEITAEVEQRVRASKVELGVATIYIPHTTAGVTINENADPDVVHDMLKQLEEMVPWSQPFYEHGEGNSAAHVKATMTGSSVQVLIESSKLLLGRWQGIWFCEFDGPRTRNVNILIR